MWIRNEVRGAWRKLVLDIQPTMAITLGIGLQTTAERLNRDAELLFNRVQRRAYGPRWFKQPASERISAIGFHEHPDSNRHMHVALAGGYRVCERLMLDGSRFWKDIRTAGDFYVEPIGNVEGYADYITKDARSERSWETVYVYRPADWREL